jgi:hypothetical protein
MELWNQSSEPQSFIGIRIWIRGFVSLNFGAGSGSYSFVSDFYDVKKSFIYTFLLILTLCIDYNELFRIVNSAEIKIFLFV